MVRRTFLAAAAAAAALAAASLVAQPQAPASWSEPLRIVTGPYLQGASETGMTIIPPYDDLDVIAGQGTIGLEILHQAPRDLSAIFVPVGGGGLASGIAAVVKEVRPQVRVIGVEPVDADAMVRSLREGHRVVLDHVGIFD